jgi:hypothetical protein
VIIDSNIWVAVITPGHHDAVTGLQDRFQITESLPTLDFRNDGEVSTALLQECSYLLHVLRAADKREGQIVRLLRYRELEVLSQLRCEERSCDTHPRHDDPTARGQSSANDDATDDVGAAGPLDLQLHRPVVE